jgi:hypothetical protein
MSLTGGNASQRRGNNVYFGNGIPALSPYLRENDTYFQTDTGLSNGVVLFEFVYSGTEWIKSPVSGVTTPPSWDNVSW